MAEFYKGVIPIIDTEGARTDLSHPAQATFGMVPRDYKLYPESMFSAPSELKVIPESEWDARYDEQEATESSLEHMYLRGGQPAFVNLDQNGQGFCWAYSTGHALMLDRLRANLPLVRLNPHATACIIKNGRDEGGWCGLSASWARDNGYAVEGNGPDEWPLHAMSLKYDTPALREAMSRHKVIEDYYDLTRQVYDQVMTESQLTTLEFNNIPHQCDYNWWSHSVCGVRKVRIEKGSWGRLILNSWLGWGRFGLAVLRGSQMTPNNAVAVRSSVASII